MTMYNVSDNYPRAMSVCVTCGMLEFPCKCFTLAQAIMHAINEAYKYDEFDCHTDVTAGAHAEWCLRQASDIFRATFGKNTSRRDCDIALYWFYKAALNH